LTFAKQSSQNPRWSPDGKWLTFVSKRGDDKHAQTYRISAFGGEAERLTKVETDIQKASWSPDGESIAFLAPEHESVADKERKEKYGDYHVEDTDYKRIHLWILNLEDKKVHKLAGDDTLHIMDFEWHPGGKRIAFTAWPSPDFKESSRSTIHLVDVATFSVKPLTKEGCSGQRWSPDGKQLAYLYTRPLSVSESKLCVMPADGGEQKVICEALSDIMGLEKWGADGIYLSRTIGTEIHLVCVNPETEEWDQISPEDQPGWLGMDYNFSQNHSRITVAASSIGHCAEIHLIDVADGSTRFLTNINDTLADWRLGRSEVIQWESVDGTLIEGVLTKPDDFDPEKQYPLLVVIHGGPTWVSTPALFSQYGRAYYPIHQWAGKGALILQPNYRGSIGYGEDFLKLNKRNLGMGDYEDVISGVDALIEKGWVDPERVGAMGWSQGGYISAFITTYSDRFKATSVGAGISSWYTYYVNTDIHPFTRVYLGANPWDDQQIYDKTSPITYLKNAKTPTLIQHGEFDKRVPIPNAYELYQGLQDMGVEVKLVVYKGMPHGIIKPRLNRQVMQENLDWFNRWIWDEEPEAKPAPPCYIAIANSGQVEDVRHWGRRDKVDYRLFSGQLGLSDDSLSGDEHILKAEDVSTIATMIVKQIKEHGWTKLVLHTDSIEKEPTALIYLGCLQVAAGIVGKVTIEHQQISNDNK
jgi:dipeptidyl aminopeptidase/acylaminoacyl peptidase